MKLNIIDCDKYKYNIIEIFQDYSLYIIITCNGYVCKFSLSMYHENYDEIKSSLINKNDNKMYRDLIIDILCYHHNGILKDELSSKYVKLTD
jgi:hypothetical protein